MKLKLTTKKSLDKQGKVEKVNGKDGYKQHDASALMSLLNGVNFKLYDMKSYKHCLNLKDKIEEAWRKDEKEVDLPLDEITFLKDYLENIKEKAMPQVILIEFHIRTIVFILEQIKEK